MAVPLARSETWALLVGVSGYPAFPEHLRLRGPANDVRLMRQVLLERGVRPDQITMLADTVTGTALPTQAGIMAALERMARLAAPGDTVVLQLAGHGSKQAPEPGAPAQARGSDGLVKTFLPFDAGPWNGGQARVERALTGDTLRRAVDAITARGADVFMLVDACYSAALVRGVGTANTGLRWRSPAGQGAAAGAATQAPGVVEPGPGGVGDVERLPNARDTLLGEPAASVAANRGAEVGLSTLGRTAFYYAAQADQATPEIMASPGLVGEAAAPYGLFSLTVAQVLRRAQQRGRTISYSQLSQQVMAEYAAQPAGGATPLLTGNGLDLPILGRAQVPLRQWLVEPDKPTQLAAGTVDGLGPGGVLSLLSDATASDGETLGFATVIEAGPRWARLQPRAHAGRQAPDERALGLARVARLVSQPAPIALRIALAPNACRPGCALQQAVQRLQREPPGGLALEWVSDPARAELTLWQLADQVRITSLPTSNADAVAADAAAEVVPIQGDADRLAAALAQRLHALARVRNLLRLAARLPNADSGTVPVMQLEVQAAGGARRAWPAADVPRLRSGDQLHLTLVNPSSQGWDITVLVLDAANGIEAIFPGPAGESNRLPPGARVTIAGGLRVQVPPSGIERLLMVAVPQRRLREATRFTFLEQPPLTRPRDVVDPDLQALFDAVFAPSATARGGPVAALPPDDLVMQVYTADVRR